ncbi:MAG: hypothetical protein U0U70_06770 [Chitinophagaceae bacterium]
MNRSLLQKLASLFLPVAIFMGPAASLLHAQVKESCEERFLRLLNTFHLDSLEQITTENFTLFESYVNHTWTKRGFLDTFVTQSKSINGTFHFIRRMQSQAGSVTFLVEDKSDYIRYLRPREKLKWALTIYSDHNRVSGLRSDSTSGFRHFMDDFKNLHDAFSAWLKETYPDENEDQLLWSNRLRGRLKEYAERNNQ